MVQQRRDLASIGEHHPASRVGMDGDHVLTLPVVRLDVNAVVVASLLQRREENFKMRAEPRRKSAIISEVNHKKSALRRQHTDSAASS